LATRSANLQMTNCPLSGRGQSYATHSRISHNLKYLWNGWSYSFVCLQAMSNVSLPTTDHPWNRRGQGHAIHFRIVHPL